MPMQMILMKMNVPGKALDYMQWSSMFYTHHPPFNTQSISMSSLLVSVLNWTALSVWVGPCGMSRLSHAVCTLHTTWYVASSPQQPINPSISIQSCQTAFPFHLSHAIHDIFWMNGRFSFLSTRSLQFQCDCCHKANYSFIYYYSPAGKILYQLFSSASAFNNHSSSSASVQHPRI